MSGDQAGNMAEITQISQEIGALLVKTLTPDSMKAAEKGLIKLETSTKLYGLATLYLTRRQDLSTEVQTSAAIAFKNFIRRNWRFDPNDETTDQVDRIDASQRDLIKQHIVEFMLSSPSHIQRQLSEAIAFIGQCDFPDKWPSLIVELEKFLGTGFNQNFNTLQGILHTAHSITRRYRFELPSDRLWSEIKLVITHFGQPLTDRFVELNSARNMTSQPTELEPIYKSLLLCTEIYHSLITQDLPEFFEDKLNDWIPHLIDLLAVETKIPSSSVIEDLKSEICEIAGLFVQRYSDAENFSIFTEKFALNIWQLLTSTNVSQDLQYDTLVSTAIRYLVIVAERPETRTMFQTPGMLDRLCMFVILPNLAFREIDEELFEDDPEEYVRRDIEGSDVDTKRRAACDLVQVLCKFLEVQLIEAFGCYIQTMLKQYETDKSTNWRLKDTAIFTYSAMAIKGSTRQHGTVSISQHVDIVKFFDDNVISELMSDTQTIGANILKADAFRYITTFRNYIPLDKLVSHLPVILKHITSRNIVVRTYASITLEKLLTMRDRSQPQTTAFRPQQFEPILGDLIKTLLDALDMPGSGENEHIMKALMRLFSFSRSSLIVQFLPTVVPRLTNKLGIVARNPSKPYFNHYLFETLALTIKAACSQDNLTMRTEFESVLFNILEVVLAQDVQEFTPYCLQLLNLVLQAQAVGSVSERFVKLFHDLLSPVHWEKSANVRPLTELMHTYIQKIGQQIVVEGKLDPMLGIFQKLIASKATDHEGLALLQTMMIHLPSNEFDARIRGIFMLIFQRLTGSKTVKFVKGVLECFSLYAFLRGADSLASSINQLQDKLFAMVIDKLYIVDVKKVTGVIERRICVCGMIKILSQLPLIENGAYNNLWAPLLIVLMEIFEIPQEVTNDADDHFVDVTESFDFQAQYSKLNFASRKRDDPTKEVGDLKLLLAVSLANLSTKLPGFLPKVVQENLSQDAVNCLMNYCKAANVAIS